MKNKVMRSVKKRILTVLFVSVAVLFVVIFGMTTVECVKVFTSDAERAAETKTQEAADLFDACAREYVLKTELLAADLKGDIYVTDDEYKALDDKLRAEAAGKRDFFLFRCLTTAANIIPWKRPITETVPK